MRKFISLVFTGCILVVCVFCADQKIDERDSVVQSNGAGFRVEEPATGETAFPIAGAAETPQNKWPRTFGYTPNASGWDGFTTLADFYDTFEKDGSKTGKPALQNGKQYSGIGYGFLIGGQTGYAEKGIIGRKPAKDPHAFLLPMPSVTVVSFSDLTQNKEYN